MSDYKLLCNKFSLTSNGITINPIGDTGFEPVTLPVLPVLRTTISTNLRELPSACILGYLLLPLAIRRLLPISLARNRTLHVGFHSLASALAFPTRT